MHDKNVDAMTSKEVEVDHQVEEVGHVRVMSANYHTDDGYKRTALRWLNKRLSNG